MKAPLSYAPALPAATGIVCGILLYHTGYLVIPLILCLVAFGYLYATSRHYVAFFAVMTGIGLMLAYTMRPPELSPALFDAKHQYTGYVERASSGYTMMIYDVEIVSIDNTPVTPFDCRVNVTTVESPAIPGTEVSFTAQLQTLDSQPVIPYDFDYNKYLRLNGMSAKCSVRQFDAIGCASAWDRTVNDMRDGIYNSIVESPITPGLSSFLLATILGDDTMLCQDDREQFRQTGIAHILALSGLHVGILASLLTLLLLPIRMNRYGRYINSVLTLCAIWTYVIIVGFAPSIARAAIMLSTYLIARLIQRGSNSYNSLFLSIVIILAINPNALFTPGFQLSVAAVASILMFGTLGTRWLSRPVVRYIVDILTVPVAAMLGTGLVSIYYFNLMPGMFILGNVVTGVMLPWILGGGVVLIVLTAIGLNFGLLGSMLDTLYWAMMQSVQWLADIRIAAIDDIFINGWVLLPYSVMLVMLALSINYRKSYLWTLTGIMLVATALTAALSTTTIPRHELYVIGDSQSTQILMRTDHHAYLLSTIPESMRESELSEASDRHHRFLANRRCDNTFVRVTSPLADGPFAYDGRMLSFDGRSMTIVNSDSLTASNSHHDYVLVANGYTRHITELISAYHPDTVLIGTDVHPRRRQRWLRELANSIPSLDLREHPIAVVWAK